ncbi:MAG: SGNH hydrolase domain-containing protein, partial [Actinomycetota bacterium]
AVAVMPRILDHDSTTVPNSTQLATTGFTPVPTNLDFAAIKGDIATPTSCYRQPASSCTIVTGTGPHALLIGDSHAAMMIPTLTQVAERLDLTLSASVGFVCPWQLDLYALPERSSAQRISDCSKSKSDLYDRVIPELDPDIVVVMNRGYERADQGIPYLGPDRFELENGTAEYDNWLEQSTFDSAGTLTAAGRKLVIIEPIPFGEVNQLTCLSKATVVEECRYVVSPASSPLEQVYRRLDRREASIWSVDIDRLVCPFLPICDPIVNGRVVRSDWTHLTTSFARALAPAVTDHLVSNGVVDR